MRRRLADRVFWRKFVCFTFDDGYRDNLEHAYPILKRHGVPFALYMFRPAFPTGWASCGGSRSRP